MIPNSRPWEPEGDNYREDAGNGVCQPEDDDDIDAFSTQHVSKEFGYMCDQLLQEVNYFLRGDSPEDLSNAVSDQVSSRHFVPLCKLGYHVAREIIHHTDRELKFALHLTPTVADKAHEDPRLCNAPASRINMEGDDRHGIGANFDDCFDAHSISAVKIVQALRRAMVCAKMHTTLVLTLDKHDDNAPTLAVSPCTSRYDVTALDYCDSVIDSVDSVWELEMLVDAFNGIDPYRARGAEKNIRPPSDIDPPALPSALLNDVAEPATEPAPGFSLTRWVFGADLLRKEVEMLCKVDLVGECIAAHEQLLHSLGVLMAQACAICGTGECAQANGTARLQVPRAGPGDGRPQPHEEGMQGIGWPWSEWMGGDVGQFQDTQWWEEEKEGAVVTVEVRPMCMIKRGKDQTDVWYRILTNATQQLRRRLTLGGDARNSSIMSSAEDPEFNERFAGRIELLLHFPTQRPLMRQVAALENLLRKIANGPIIEQHGVQAALSDQLCDVEARFHRVLTALNSPPKADASALAQEWSRYKVLIAPKFAHSSTLRLTCVDAVTDMPLGRDEYDSARAYPVDVQLFLDEGDAAAGAWLHVKLIQYTEWSSEQKAQSQKMVAVALCLAKLLLKLGLQGVLAEEGIGADKMDILFGTFRIPVLDDFTATSPNNARSRTLRKQALEALQDKTCRKGSELALLQRHLKNGGTDMKSVGAFIADDKPRAQLLFATVPLSRHLFMISHKHHYVKNALNNQRVGVEFKCTKEIFWDAVCRAMSEILGATWVGDLNN